MTAADNKHTVMRLCARLSAGDIQGALAMMTDDVMWRLPGTPALFPIAGDYGKQPLQRLFERMQSQLDERGLHLTVVGLVAEGDVVAAEVEGHGELRNGRTYRQRYHLALVFRDGKIAKVREYFDTHHAFDVWIKP